MSDTDIFSLNACYLSTDISCNATQMAEINKLCDILFLIIILIGTNLSWLRFSRSLAYLLIN